MCRRAVQIEVVFFDILAVVSLAVRQAEQAFLKDWIAAVPEGERKTDQLLVAANTGKAVFTPVIRTRPGLIMAEVVPGVSILTVVLANRAPLTLAKVWTP